MKKWFERSLIGAVLAAAVLLMLHGLGAWGQNSGPVKWDEVTTGKVWFERGEIPLVLDIMGLSYLEARPGFGDLPLKVANPYKPTHLLQSTQVHEECGHTRVYPQEGDQNNSVSPEEYHTICHQTANVENDPCDCGYLWIQTGCSIQDYTISYIEPLPCYGWPDSLKGCNYEAIITLVKECDCGFPEPPGVYYDYYWPCGTHLACNDMGVYSLVRCDREGYDTCNHIIGWIEVGCDNSATLCYH